MGGEWGRIVACRALRGGAWRWWCSGAWQGEGPRVECGERPEEAREGCVGDGVRVALEVEGLVEGADHADLRHTVMAGNRRGRGAAACGFLRPT